MTNENPTGQSSSGTEVDQLKNQVESLKDELESVKQDFHAYRKAVSKKFSNHQDELEDLEAQFQQDNPKGSSTDDTDSDGTQTDMLPIERLSRLKNNEQEQDNPFGDTTPSVDRAVTIFDHFRQWSEKAPKGRVITNGLKTLLETATDENLYWSQIKRACRKVEEFSKGAIQFKKTSRHGNILIAQNQSVLATTG